MTNKLQVAPESLIESEPKFPNHRPHPDSKSWARHPPEIMASPELSRTWAGLLGSQPQKVTSPQFSHSLNNHPPLQCCLCAQGHCCCCSVTKLCLTFFNPMDCSVPGSSVLHYLPEFALTHVDWVGYAIQPSHPLSIPFSSYLHSFPASGSFPMSWLFASGAQIIGTSASASVLPMNIQGWFPLGLIGLILQSKGLSRVFSSLLH